MGTMCNDIEPFHAIYSDATREIDRATLEGIIDSLLHLYQLGFAKPYFISDDHR